MFSKLCSLNQVKGAGRGCTHSVFALLPVTFSGRFSWISLWTETRWSGGSCRPMRTPEVSTTRSHCAWAITQWTGSRTPWWCSGPNRTSTFSSVPPSFFPSFHPSIHLKISLHSYFGRGADSQYVVFVFFSFLSFFLSILPSIHRYLTLWRGWIPGRHGCAQNQTGPVRHPRLLQFSLRPSFFPSVHPWISLPSHFIEGIFADAMGTKQDQNVNFASIFGGTDKTHVRYHLRTHFTRNVRFEKASPP